MSHKRRISFSQMWEDHNVIEEALKIKKDDTVVSILSAGDNLLNLLRFTPEKIYGFDKNPAQIYEVKLKIAAIKHLNHREFITLIGYSGSAKERLKLFQLISEELDNDVYTFWKDHQHFIKKGIVFQGGFDKKLYLQRKLLKFALSSDYNRYLFSDSIDERRKIYQKRIDRPIIRFISKIRINRNLLKTRNRGAAKKNIPSSFDYNKNFWEKMNHVFVDVGSHNNPYLYLMFTGKLPDNQLYWQPYLQEKNYDILRQNLEKIKIIEKDLYNGLKEIDNDSIDAFYVSDIFDWMNINEMEKNLIEIIRVAKNNAKIISFVLTYDKGVPNNVQTWLTYDETVNTKLLKMDRIGLYKKIYLWTVKK